MNTNLPVLKTYQYWELVLGSGRTTSYLIPGEWNIDEPGHSYYINCSYIKRELEYHGRSIQEYYERWFLNHTVESEYARCANETCRCKLPFTRISNNGYGHMAGQTNFFCSFECRDEYSHRHRLNGFELQNDYPDDYPALQDWYAQGGGLKYYQDNKDDYGYESSGSLNQVRYQEAKRRLAAVGKSKGFQGIHISRKTNKYYIYKSLVEKNMMKYLDEDPSVLSYDYESIRLAYLDPLTDSYKTYIPDFIVHYSDGSTKLIECKYDDSWKLDMVVLAKNKVAEEWCKEHNATFEIWTHFDFE